LLDEKGINYYGEVEFNLTYKKQSEIPVDWLYVDFETLKNFALVAGLSCEKLTDGENFDYLAKLQSIDF